MAVHTLRWQGPRRQEACRTHVEQLVDGWARDWFIDSGTGATVGSLPAVDTAMPMRWFSGTSGEASVQLGVLESAFATLGSRMLALGAASTKHQGLELEITQKSLIDLVSRLCGGSADLVVDVDAGAPAESSCTERFGNLGFVLESPLSRARLYVNAAWCNRFIPATPMRQFPRLTERSKALTHSKVSVQAFIELGSLPLIDSFGWRVGEVLVTDASRDAAVRVQSNGRVITAGRLLVEPGLRTIQLSTDIIE